MQLDSSAKLSSFNTQNPNKNNSIGTIFVDCTVFFYRYWEMALNFFSDQDHFCCTFDYGPFVHHAKLKVNQHFTDNWTCENKATSLAERNHKNRNRKTKRFCHNFNLLSERKLSNFLYVITAEPNLLVMHKYWWIFQILVNVGDKMRSARLIKTLYFEWKVQ